MIKRVGSPTLALRSFIHKVNSHRSRARVSFGGSRASLLDEACRPPRGTVSSRSGRNSSRKMGGGGGGDLRVADEEEIQSSEKFPLTRIKN